MTNLPNRLNECLREIKNQHKKALIPYITAGDPNAKVSLELMHVLVTAGADIIELGMPFSDPTADGPVIQAAHERALKAGMTLSKTLSLVQEFRKKNNKTPIVLMGYLNPIAMMGFANFIAQANNAGVDGILIVDMPIEEGEAFFADLKNHNLEPIFLVAPTTAKDRLVNICQHAKGGFIYYVSLKGVTGAPLADILQVKQKIVELRNNTNTPIAIGFGIRDATSAKIMAEIADAIVIGSAIETLIAQEQANPEKMQKLIKDFLQEIKSAIAVSS